MIAINLQPVFQAESLSKGPTISCVERLRQGLIDFYGVSRVPLDIIYEKLCDDETGKGLRWKIISVVMPSCYG